MSETSKTSKTSKFKVGQTVWFELRDRDSELPRWDFGLDKGECGAYRAGAVVEAVGERVGVKYFTSGAVMWYWSFYEDKLFDHDPSDGGPVVPDAKPPVLKHTAGRARLELIPLAPLSEVARVYEYGLTKYPSTHSWRGGVEYMSLIGATLRHITAWVCGEERAEDSNGHHLAHAIANLLMILDQMAYRRKAPAATTIDDRPAPADAGLYRDEGV